MMVMLTGVAMQPVFAVGDGFYLGGQVGPSRIQASSGTVNGQAATVDKKGVGARLYMGYQINQYAAWEFGFTQFGAATYDVPAPSGNKPQIRQNALDLVGKGMFPFGTSGWNIFGKAGFAYARSSSSGSLVPVGETNSTDKTVRIVAGAGVSYDLTQHWVADLSLTHLFGGGGVKTSDLVAIGISWHFVDEKCGQFLC